MAVAVDPNQDVRERIRARAIELGFDLCRFTSADPPPHTAVFLEWLGAGHHGTMEYLNRNAGKRVDPAKVLPGARSLILLAASYHRKEDPAPVDSSHGVVARYAAHRDYHDVLKVPLQALCQFISSASSEAPASLWYVDTGPFLERDLAQRAGLGFVGKHTNLISRSLGNWFFICEIITTLKIPPDASEPNRCGTCARCLAACPTNAITSPFHLDARKCISYLTIELKGSIPLELRERIGTRIYGCDDCLAVCPWNRFAKEGSLMKEHRREDLQAPDLIELLRMDQDAFKQRFDGTPVLRTKRRGLLRNVCVALGNLKDRAALPALEKATHDPEELVREHAAWAVQQIERSTNPERKGIGEYSRDGLV